MDEIAITCVHRSNNIVASKGVRRVVKITSGERGNMVTVFCVMRAVGAYLPPMFLFPRKRMVEVLMNGAPSQSLGQANPIGWMNEGMFVKWLNHFVKFTNRHGHFAPTLHAQDAVRRQNILEKCVRCGIRHMDGFEPRKRISYYQMAGIFGTAYVRTSSQSKAIKGFQSCGLWPFDDNIFGNEKFAAAEVTEEGLSAGQHACRCMCS